MTHCCQWRMAGIRKFDQVLQRGRIAVQGPLDRVESRTQQRRRLVVSRLSAFWYRGCSVSRSKMRHLVCVCLHEGRAGRGARDIVTTSGMFRQPVEPTDKAQHICHEYVGD